ncbi:MAG: epoxyqueuosine reductase [Firmicutes bacterium HGW-Firmicutes-14]|nr:MAG: epoxyqueuosine reductase [Firmicutes bacterium HGW-Firmicutes-14]
MKRSAADFYYSGNSLLNKYSQIDSRPFLKMVKSWGATLAGAGDVREGLAYEFKYIPVAISLAIAHPPIGESILRKDSVIAYTNQFPAIDMSLEHIQKRIASYLRSFGWKAFIIPPDTDKVDYSFAAKLYPLFPHKTAATCAGLGWVGKNGLLITKEYGARLSWGTVLTDAPLKVAGNPYTESGCNSCNRCVDACPAGAIKGELWSRGDPNRPLLDIEKCAGQLEYHSKVIGKSICAHCIVACPIGNRNNIYLSKLKVSYLKGGDGKGEAKT